MVSSSGSNLRGALSAHLVTISKWVFLAVFGHFDEFWGVLSHFGAFGEFGEV